MAGEWALGHRKAGDLGQRVSMVACLLGMAQSKRLRGSIVECSRQPRSPGHSTQAGSGVAEPRLTPVSILPLPGALGGESRTTII